MKLVLNGKKRKVNNMKLTFLVVIFFAVSGPRIMLQRAPSMLECEKALPSIQKQLETEQKDLFIAECIEELGQE